MPLGKLWQGKAIGATIGIFTGGPVGALIGAFVGHWFDQEAERNSDPVASAATPEQVQNAFFRTAFQVMGTIAKADGRVSEDDIRAARAMMSELRLDESQVQLAIDCFAAGKAQDFPLRERLEQLAALCRERRDLKRMFVQIQLQTALRAGSLQQPARKVLAIVCDALEISTFDLVQMEALLRMQQHGTQAKRADTLTAAYEVLGVSAQAADQDVTKAYRRLMNQNHPDKLVAKGLPESMMNMAAEKTRQIRAAYERICEARGMR
ncbi:MAG: co-chaperone DjlA [Steroidobacteraceae bacterium]